MSTFIVETDPETYKKAGFSVQDEHSIKSYCEQVFVTDLEGHELLTNKSVLILKEKPNTVASLKLI